MIRILFCPAAMSWQTRHLLGQFLSAEQKIGAIINMLYEVPFSGVSRILGKQERKAGTGNSYRKSLMKDIMQICTLDFTA